MNLLLTAARLYVPSSIKTKRLHELFDITADAFHCKAPGLDGLSFNECLSNYALFTREKAEECIRQGNDPEIKPRLYQNAYALAQSLKTSYHVKNEKDVINMARIVYRILGIDFECNRQGEIRIGRCFFSSYYSGRVCRIISSLDEGLMEGLSGGAFRFSQRITEGGKCCLAHLSFNRSAS
jgi:hypothetical protein